MKLSFLVVDVHASMAQLPDTRAAAAAAAAAAVVVVGRVAVGAASR